MVLQWVAASNVGAGDRVYIGCRRGCQREFWFTTMDLTLTDHAPATLVSLLENLFGFRWLDRRAA